jgi:hypothetical protein
MTPFEPNATFATMLVQPKPPSCNKDPTTHFINFFTIYPPMIWAMDRSSNVRTQLSNTYTCNNNNCWLLIEVTSSQLIKRNEAPTIVVFKALKTWLMNMFCPSPTHMH